MNQETYIELLFSYHPPSPAAKALHDKVRQSLQVLHDAIQEVKLTDENGHTVPEHYGVVAEAVKSAAALAFEIASPDAHVSHAIPAVNELARYRNWLNKYLSGSRDQRCRDQAWVRMNNFGFILNEYIALEYSAK